MSLPDRRVALLLAALSISLAACSRTETAPEASTPAASPVATTPAPASATTEETAAPSTPITPVETPAEVAAAPPAAPSLPPAPVAPPPIVASTPPPAFASCGGCHSIEQGAPHKMGPNLFGVVGSQAGSQAGYAYSPAMSGAGIVWTESSLDAFLAAPREVVPGTRMAAPPVRDAGARRAIVEYLASLK